MKYEYGKTLDEPYKCGVTRSWYNKVHYWIIRRCGKASFCEMSADHIYKIYHWANISHEYKKELDDWIMLCPQCHRTMDINNLSVDELRIRNGNRDDKFKHPVIYKTITNKNTNPPYKKTVQYRSRETQSDYKIIRLQYLKDNFPD